MLLEIPLSFREAMSDERPAKTDIQRAVLRFLRGRDDAVLFGAHAVNAYVEPERATADVDILSTRGKDFADDVRSFLNEEFGIAVRTRSVRGGGGFRVYQRRKEGNRHLVDVRPVTEFPPTRQIEATAVVAPAELIANKVASSESRGGKMKGDTDRRDLKGLLLTFPELKTDAGEVRDRLVANGASDAVLAAWSEWVAAEIEPEGEDDDFDW